MFAKKSWRGFVCEDFERVCLGGGTGDVGLMAGAWIARSLVCICVVLLNVDGVLEATMVQDNVVARCNTYEMNSASDCKMDLVKLSVASPMCWQELAEKW